MPRDNMEHDKPDRSIAFAIICTLAVVAALMCIAWGATGCALWPTPTPSQTRITGGEGEIMRADIYEPMTDADIDAKIDALIALLRARRTTDAREKSTVDELTSILCELRDNGKRKAVIQSARASQPSYTGTPPAAMTLSPVTLSAPDPDNPDAPHTTSTMDPAEMRGQDEAAIQTAIIHAQGVAASGMTLVWIGGALTALGILIIAALKAYKIGGTLTGAGAALAVAAMTLQDRPELGAVVLAAVGVLMLAGIVLAVWSEWQARRTAKAAAEIVKSVDTPVHEWIKAPVSDVERAARADAVRAKQGPLAQKLVDKGQGKA